MSRNWNAQVQPIVAEFEAWENVFGCSTYPGHGATDTGVDGEPWGIDVQVANWGSYANKAQEACGDRVQKFVEANWSRLGIHYMIWWGYITYSPGAWQRYNPAGYKNPAASTDPETAMHMDHVHLQIHTNYRYQGAPGGVPSPKERAGETGAKKFPKDVLFGIDVAGYQRGIDMKRVKQEGYEFAIVKATEGPYPDSEPFRNPEYTRQIAGARAAGMVTGAYHFLIETSPEEQADHFLSVVRDGEPKILVVDFEAYNAPYEYLTPTNATLRSFIAAVRRKVGEQRPIVVYSGRGFWNGGEPSGPLSLYGRNLHAWDAMYRSNDPIGNPRHYYARVHGDGWGKPWGGVEPVMWQFTPGGRVAGLDVDVNAFAGTKTDLWALADWDVPQPRRTKPVAPPKAPPKATPAKPVPVELPEPPPAEPTLPEPVDHIVGRVEMLEGSVTRLRGAISRTREDVLSISAKASPAKPAPTRRAFAQGSPDEVEPKGTLEDRLAALEAKVTALRLVVEKLNSPDAATSGKPVSSHPSGDVGNSVPDSPAPGEASSPSIAPEGLSPTMYITGRGLSALADRGMAVHRLSSSPSVS